MVDEQAVPKVSPFTFEEDYPGDLSFDEEPRPLRCDLTVMHRTVGGRGVVGRLTDRER